MVIYVFVAVSLIIAIAVANDCHGPAHFMSNLVINLGQQFPAWAHFGRGCSKLHAHIHLHVLSAYVCMYVTCFLNGLSFAWNCHSAEQLSMQTDQQVRARSQLGKKPRDVFRTFHKSSISMYRRTCRVCRRVANWLFDASILYLTINARIINVLPSTPQNPEINTSSIIVTTANTQSPTHTHTELHSHNKIKSSAVKYKNCLLIGHVPACAAAWQEGCPKRLIHTILV